jgi:hypothetical protein
MSRKGIERAQKIPIDRYSRTARIPEMSFSYLPSLPWIPDPRLGREI